MKKIVPLKLLYNKIPIFKIDYGSRPYIAQFEYQYHIKKYSGANSAETILQAIFLDAIYSKITDFVFNYESENFEEYIESITRNLSVFKNQVCKEMDTLNS